MSTSRGEWIATASETSAIEGAPLLHELFEQQAENCPDAVAVVCEQHALTFAQLDCRASRLARHLQFCGIGPDQLVVLCLERSVEMLVGIIGIWKAGGAYVPLDPSYPVERIAQVVNDSEARVILTQTALAPRISALAEHCVSLDVEDESLCSPEGIAPQAAPTDRNLAYVIYTSGSSGAPKGVMVEHRSVVNLWHALRPIYPAPGTMRRVAVNAALTFDSSVKQLLQLLSGSTLYIVPQVLRLHARMLLRYLDSERIDAIDCTPTQLKTWIAAGLFQRSAATPRIVLIGGEAIDRGLWQRLAQYGKIDFYNLYGPTECTVDATSAQVVGPGTEPHIGRPLLGVQVQVLDPQRRLVAAAEAGEIWIGGVGVARGYLKRPALTAERFVLDPADTAGKARLYRTGDLGRWRANGNLEYLGRADAQVKIRGMRIELGEIEAALSRHSEVREAAVIVRADAANEQRLIAYVGTATDAAGSSIAAAELRNFLCKLLPEPMVPSAFVILDRLPVNANGKVDRRALQGAESSQIGAGSEPDDRSETESSEEISENPASRRMSTYDPHIYDLRHACRTADIDFYVEHAQRIGGPVLELCCGTGRITIPMARTGLRITGLDIAEELLERARRKAIAAGLDIEWLRGDAASFQLDRKFRLITMPFNSLRHLCRATQIESFFLAARAHLSDGGMLIFDVPNPDLGELVLGRRAGGEFLEPDSGERVTVEWEIRYDDAQQISHRTARFSTSGGRSYVGNRLQFRCFYPQELDLLVRMGGFRIIHKFGDFTGKPFVSGSPSQIVVATVA